MTTLQRLATIFLVVLLSVDTNSLRADEPQERKLYCAHSGSEDR